jgi:8-oxo-dGTP pyrophosphatase MutT (NUDIX family)
MTFISVNQNNQKPQAYAGAGIILTRNDNGIHRVLLLRGTEGGVWSFSKGRPEQDDRGRPLCTAVRETYEETGFVNECDYTIYGSSIRFGKRPYWVAVVKPEVTHRIRLNPREHDAAGWFTWEEVARLTSNTDVRSWTKRIGPATNFYHIISYATSASIPSKHWNVVECSAS